MLTATIETEEIIENQKQDDPEALEECRCKLRRLKSDLEEAERAAKRAKDEVDEHQKLHCCEA